MLVLAKVDWHVESEEDGQESKGASGKENNF